MSELDKLINELRNMKDDDRASFIANNKDTWSKIGSKEWADLGITSESELQAFIQANPYSNIG